MHKHRARGRLLRDLCPLFLKCYTTIVKTVIKSFKSISYYKSNVNPPLYRQNNQR